MDIESDRAYRQNRASTPKQDSPPSFDYQVNNKAFKRKVGLIKRLKSKIFGTLRKGITTNVRDYKVSNADEIPLDELQLLDDEYPPYIRGVLTIEEQVVHSDKSFKLDANIRKQLIEMLKHKNFSESQAKSIINKKFKKCKVAFNLTQACEDIPEKVVFDKGYDSITLLDEYLKEKLAYLIRLGYNSKDSEKEILEAFERATNKQEFDNYIDSIPLYKFYQKGYTSNKDIETNKKAAHKKLLKLGYSSNYAYIHIEEKFNDPHNYKEDFLKAIDDTPHININNKGYKTVTEYNNLREACIQSYKDKFGYSDKKAKKEAIAKQNKYHSKTDFISYIREINPEIEL